MKLNELLKSFSLKNISIFLIFFLIINYPDVLISAEKKKLQKTDYIVHVYLRNFYDLKDDKYNQKSEFNVSGFNDNAKWDSIFMLTQFISSQKPKAWWFNCLNKPSSVIIRFHNKKKAESFCSKIEKGDYNFIARELKLEKYLFS